MEHSDFLIVICSKAACESRWVQREMEYFSKIHGTDHILAVLADDEPAEAFPYILCFREVTVKDVDGSEYLIREEVEPLAADVRGASKKIRLKKVDNEILRLIAPMLHCTYDELKQRHRAYRLKQIAAVTCLFLSLFAGIGGYSLYKNIQINKANQERLFIQSQYFASLALAELQDNQPLKALSYAFLSLPSNGNTRSVPAATQYVLSKALNTYTSPDDNKISVTATYESGDGYSASKEYFADDKNQILFIGNHQSIDIWDLEQNALDDSIFPADSGSIKVLKEDLLLPEEHVLYYATDNHIYAYDYITKTVEWEIALDSIKDLMYIAKSHELMVFTDTSLYRLDAANVSCTVDKIDIPAYYTISADSIAVSEDENFITFDLLDESTEVSYDLLSDGAWSFESEWTYQEKTREQMRDLICVFDLISNEPEYIDPEIGLIEYLEYIDENTILVISDNGLRANYVSDYTYHMEQINHVNLSLFDLKDKKNIWENSVTYGAFDSKISTLKTGDHNLLISLANKCILIDVSSGDVLKTWEADSEILHLFDSNDTSFRAFTKSGNMLYGELEENFWRTAAIFEADACEIVPSSQCFFVRYLQNNESEDTYLAKYEFVSDNNYCAIDDKEAEMIKTKIEDLQKEQADMEELPKEWTNLNIHSFFITPAGEYLLLEHNGTITKYASDGKTLKWSISDFDINLYSPVWSMIDDSRVVLISSIGGGIELNISDSTYGVTASIEKLRFYDAATDRYYVGDTMDNTISGYFPRITLSDLIVKAEEIHARNH